MTKRAGSVVLLLVGIAIGCVGFSLGAVLAAPNNGWDAALWYSVVGLVGGPVSTLSWRSRRSTRRTLMAGAAFALGILGTLVLLLEITNEASGLANAWARVPFVVGLWLLTWLSWQLTALARLLMFEAPRRTHQRLSSRRGDQGI